MPKVKTTPPPIDDHKNERNIDLPVYLDRIVPGWNSPSWLTAQGWRNVVSSQPLLSLCKETITGYVLSKEWKVEPRDSTQRDELKGEIDYYTRFFENTGDYEYSHIIEWLLNDMLDLPFGAAAEVGRAADSPEGRVQWIELLDGGTLYPTLNFRFPVCQYVPEAGMKTVYFPKHAIDRIYMSPRTDIRRKGWGMPPPEKIYLAIMMVSKGDTYYYGLLLDTPPTGILDLIDMSKDSAVAWVKAWKDTLTGIDAFKIPVLYEHEKAAQWIGFTRNPSEIAFLDAISRYGAMVTAGYGLSLSDLGLSGSTGDRSLAGTIREERKTRSLGIARAVRNVTAFFNNLLPSTLRFRVLALDDELMASLGRARLATATALNALVQGNVITGEEARQQFVADGLMTITIPEKLPQELKDKTTQQAQGNSPERPTMLGRPVTPGQGGWGEVTARMRLLNDVDLLKMAHAAFLPVQTDFSVSKASLGDTEIIAWGIDHEKYLWGLTDEVSDVTKSATENALSLVSLSGIPNLSDDEETDKGLRDCVVRAVIAGVRNYLMEVPDATLDDLMNGELALQLLREQIDAVCNRIEQLPSQGEQIEAMV